MALDHLPKELLLMTTAYLPATDLEALALTFNKAVTLTCLPGLQPLFSRRRHQKAMRARFGSLNNPITPAHGLVTCIEQLNIPAETKLNEYDELMSEPLDLSYLEFRGDLHWLGPLDKGTDSEMDPHKNHTSDGLQEVIEQADRAGVVLPSAFIKLFQSQELMDRIPSTSACYFEIAGGLRKCPAAIDAGAGGYVVRFYSDQQGCGHWLLYIIPGEEGSHAVLSSAIDSGEDCEEEDDDNGNDETLGGATKEEIDRANNEGWQMAILYNNVVCLEGLEFEEWLAQKYFDEWLSFAIYEDVHWNDTNAQPLRAYARQVYMKT